MVTSSDYDFTDRGSSRFFQHIQLLRCVCKRFNRLALTTLCRVLGTFVERPGGTTFGSARLAYLPVDPLDIFARYPESFAPYLKRIGLRGVVEPSNRTLRRWKLLLSAFGMCKNLNWIGISVKPPQKRKRKEALLRALGGLTNLNYLQLANKKNHGYSRWDSEDLAFLLRQTVVTKIERLILDGWDLSVFKEGLFDASLTNPRMHLLQIRSCRIGFDVLQDILRFLLPHVDDYPIIPIPSKGRVFRFSSFFPNLGLMTPQSLVPLLLAHTTYIHGLWIELTSHSRQEREHAMPKLPHSIDHSVHGFHELRALSINGEHENSTLISATFLDGLDCPFLWLLQINFCFLNTSSILAFLSTYERYASVRTSNLWMYYTPFWGDVEETAQDWARRLAGLEGETGRFEDWKDGEMGDRVYEGKHFAFCYNEGGFAAEDELSAGFWE
ncbi:hypothetical protein BT69DRAFT_1284193 [Atractiella rhizophila]|nr:hypothetical protein BT69DRAFT_1284193 [Atractiella rhizophila]